MAYVADQNEFVTSKGTSVVTTGNESGVIWYKFLTKPMDYKNEVILQQGTVGGGYSASSIWNTISRINHTSDILIEDAVTMGFTTNYGGWHSTYLNAYYHQGNNSTASGYQSWATGTYSSNNAQPSAWTSPNSLQPGPKTQNTLGILLSGTSSQYLLFSTNTWTSGGYNCPASQGYGAGVFSQNNGYTYTWGNGGPYQLNWSNSTWSATGAGEHTGGGGNYGKMLNTKLNKAYHGGDNSSTSVVTVASFTYTTNTWAATGSNQPYCQGEQSCVMGQDWGYWLGGYGLGGTWGVQNLYSCKTWYPTDTTAYWAISNGLRALSSGSGCWGPIP
jgi:hypothetical protein